jgi:hypothetical protein
MLSMEMFRAGMGYPAISPCLDWLASIDLRGDLVVRDVHINVSLDDSDIAVIHITSTSDSKDDRPD